METRSRRENIQSDIFQSQMPLTATALAEKYGVSRQVIVQDVALLRASGVEIIATPAGYIPPRQSGVVRVCACTHDNDQDMREELETIISMGGVVRDVCIDHPVYGEYRGMLMLKSAEDIDLFFDRLQKAGAEPLSAITGGAHLHTIEAEDLTTLDQIEAALRQKGFLL